MFKVEDAYIQNVDHIDDAPTKELAEKTCIMLWRLPSHNNRTLYLIFKDKPDQQSWVFAFQNYMQVELILFFIFFEIVKRNKQKAEMIDVEVLIRAEN